MSATELKPQQIDQLRDLLMEKQQALAAQKSSTDAATKPVTLDQQSVGRVSRIDAIQQQQMAIANQQQTTRSLKQIELALERIDSGEFGYCTQCEEPISFARLQVQPFANLCLNCQSASENH